MSFTLHHGPASQAKEDRFLERLASEFQQNNKPLVVVPEKSYSQRLAQKLMAKIGYPVIVGEVFLSWNDFLLKLIKKNVHRAHIANKNFSHQLLYLLLKHRHHKLINDSLDPMTFVSQIYNFHIQMKTSGVPLNQYKDYIDPNKFSDGMITWLQDYQDTLKTLSYFDAGDLQLIINQKTRNKTLQFPESCSNLFLWGLYPLHKGIREFLRHIKSHSPQLNIDIFYDEDFNQTNPMLDYIYEDLGSICDEQFFHEAQPHNIHSTQVLHPLGQVPVLIKCIQNDLEQNIKPSELGIVLLNPTIKNHVLQALKKSSISVNDQIGELLISKLDAEISLPWHIPTLIENFRRDNHFVDQKIQAHNTLEDRWAEFEFHVSVLHQFFPEVTPTEHHDFFKKQLKSVYIESSSFDQELMLMSVQQAISNSHRKLYILDAALENFLSNEEDQLVEPGLLKSAELHELVASANYRLRLKTEKFNQLLAYCKRAHVFSCKQDLGAKPLTALELPSTINVIKTNIDISKLASIEDNKSNNADKADKHHQDFFKTKKHTFSVTEIQEYINCPYKYYARYLLQLGSRDSDDLEPPHNIKGSFVHKILFRLLKEHEMEYLDSLEYLSYRDKLYKTLAKIIDEEIVNTPEFKNSNSIIVDQYAYRVYKTLISLINREAEFFKDKIKQTTPKKYYEWSFGQEPKNSLEIKTDFGSCFLRGQIDRIDVSHAHKSFCVIDYKTGDPASLKHIKQGHEIQLPVYVMVAQKFVYPDYRPSGAFFYSLKENQMKGLVPKESCDAETVSSRSRISEQDWDDVMSTATAGIRAALEGIHKGIFSPQPRNTDQCDRCDYQSVCGFQKPKCTAEGEDSEGTDG